MEFGGFETQVVILLLRPVPFDQFRISRYDVVIQTITLISPTFIQSLFGHHANMHSNTLSAQIEWFCRCSNIKLMVLIVIFQFFYCSPKLNYDISTPFKKLLIHLSRDLETLTAINKTKLY